jgi:hypothetical protein
MIFQIFEKNIQKPKTMKPCFLLLHFTKSTVCGYATKDLQKKMVSYQFLHVGLFSTVPTKHWIFFTGHLVTITGAFPKSNVSRWKFSLSLLEIFVKVIELDGGG